MIETIESPYIHTANSENFKTLVLDNSNHGIVLVNFWSKKAGPCLRQYPILDKLIWDYARRVLLVTINNDEDNKQDIQSIISRVAKDSDDLQARQQIVVHSVTHQQDKQALEELVCIMDRDQYYNDNYAKTAMPKLFNVIGTDNPLVSQFRPNLKRYAH